MGKDWRKREGIEPTGDVSASRPDLKSGGATSAPSASVQRACDLVPFVPIIHHVRFPRMEKARSEPHPRGECSCTARKNRVGTYAHVQAGALMRGSRLMGGRSTCIGKTPAPGGSGEL